MNEDAAMSDRLTSPGTILKRIRDIKPVVHSITNYVVMNSTANALLAMGASPIMAHAPEEMEDLSIISHALVINIGTLSASWIASMHKACRIAKESGKPIILDPVGAGASKLRTQTAQDLVALYSPTVVRGNASEIMSLSPGGGSTRGVDAIHSVYDAVQEARSLAGTLGTVVAVTGERDLVTDGARSFFVFGGDPMMGLVTGTGCAASVIVAAFVSMEKDAVAATTAALAFFGLAAEKAIPKSQGPGSFWMHTLDALNSVTPEELDAKARIIAA